MNPGHEKYFQALVTLQPHVRGVDADQFIDSISSFQEDGEKARVIKRLARTWSELSLGQQDRLLTETEALSDPAVRRSTLRGLGDKLAGMTDDQQVRWLNAVDSSPDKATGFLIHTLDPATLKRHSLARGLVAEMPDCSPALLARFDASA
jgi:hypothetical protein